jgi:hypothetical protein
MKTRFNDIAIAIVAVTYGIAVMAAAVAVLSG